MSDLRAIPSSPESAQRRRERLKIVVSRVQVPVSPSGESPVTTGLCGRSGYMATGQVGPRCERKCEHRSANQLGSPRHVGSLHVRGGGAFALNAVGTLTQLAVERPPGPVRDVLERIRDAFVEASPE